MPLQAPSAPRGSTKFLTTVPMPRVGISRSGVLDSPNGRKGVWFWMWDVGMGCGMGNGMGNGMAAVDVSLTPTRDHISCNATPES